MHIAPLKSARLHWRQDGDAEGHPVVFANSLGTDLRLWDKVIALLPPGFRYIRFDKRGHGLSACPPAPYSIDTLADDTAALLDHLGVRSCTFVGLSIGGMIAQTLTARRPDLVSSLVLSNSAAKMGDAAMWHDRIAATQANGLDAIADGVMARWFSEPFRKTDELEAWRNMLVRTPVQGYVGCCHAIAAADLTQSTAKLTLPTIGIAGGQDGARPPERVEGTIARTRGRFATGSTPPGTCHVSRRPKPMPIYWRHF